MTRLTLVIIAAVIILTGCGDPKPKIHTESPSATSVGDTVTLDASDTTLDRDATYTWTIDTAPYDSQATIDDPHAEVTTFTPDVPGRYEITITVANDTWSSEETISLYVIPELADGVTEVSILVIHDADTIYGWQIGRTLEEADDIIAIEYPSLVELLANAEIELSIVNVPIENASHPELYEAVDWVIQLKPEEDSSE